MCRLWEDNFAEHLVWQRELAVAFLAGVWTYNTGWKDQEGLGEQAGGLRAPVRLPAAHADRGRDAALFSTTAVAKGHAGT